jgi:hypothetical protein
MGASPLILRMGGRFAHRSALGARRSALGARRSAGRTVLEHVSRDGPVFRRFTARTRFGRKRTPIR